MVIGAAGGISSVSVLIIQHWIFSSRKCEGSFSTVELEITDISRLKYSVQFGSNLKFDLNYFLFYLRDICSAWYNARNVIPIR